MLNISTSSSYSVHHKHFYQSSRLIESKFTQNERVQINLENKHSMHMARHNTNDLFAIDGETFNHEEKY